MSQHGTADIQAELQELEQQLAQETDPYRQMELLDACYIKADDNNYQQKAYLYAGRMLEIAEELQDQIWIGKALYYQVTIEAFCMPVNSQSAIERLARAEEIFEAAVDMGMLAKVWRFMARLYSEQGNAEHARELCIKALPVFKQINNQSAYANCLYQLALIDFQLSMLQDAVEGLLEAFYIYQETGNRYGQSSCYSNLGAVYMNMREYQRAVIYYERSLDIMRQLGQPMVEAIGMCNLANAYVEIGNTDAALQNYYQAQQVFYELRYYTKEGVTWMLIGQVHATQEEYIQAHECYGKAKELLGQAEEQDVQQHIAHLYRCIAELHVKQQQWREAQEFLLKALQIADALERSVEVYALHEHLSKVYEHLGDLHQALHHHRKYTEIKDEILDEEKQKAIAEMQAKFDVESAEREKELFRVKNVELSAALEEVRLLNERLTKLNHEKNEVLSVVAHDLKSPLSGVRMVSSLLKEHYEKMPSEEVLRQLDTIEQTSERMLTIATSLLKAQTLERDGLYDITEEVDVTALVRSVLSRYAEAASQKNIALTFEPSGEQRVVCNREGLEQVVENLVSNAVKFTPTGKGVEVRIRRKKGGVRIEVQDEGPGISRKDRGRLFGKFARLSAQPTGGESTTGLGLWIAKQTAEAIGGDIRCISKSGAGARFVIHLPLGTPTEK